MFDEQFWRNVLIEFLGGVASGTMLAVLTLVLGYVHRLRIVRAIRRLLEWLESSEPK